MVRSAARSANPLVLPPESVPAGAVTAGPRPASKMSALAAPYYNLQLGWSREAASPGSTRATASNHEQFPLSQPGLHSALSPGGGEGGHTRLPEVRHHL